MSVSVKERVVHELACLMFLRCDSLVLAEGDSKAPSPPTLSSLTVEPHDLWPRPGDEDNMVIGHSM